ncbi:DegT/DnrJ/EryC1/StrS family aminotransferase [Candidatus Falkowbacteria bacterium]|nr:DegT/DnrJ/EryC1/StrS family aminotransferase [Candidatus Falkowbacteria bacterium]
MNIPLVDLKIQYQNIKQEIDQAIAEVIDSCKFINGPGIEEFENDFAKFLGAKHAIGVSNGTDAICLALMALGIKAGDEIITTPLTFIASVEPFILLGIKPVFADINEKTYSIDEDKIKAKITPKTKAIMPVHLYGNPVNIDSISQIAKDHNLFLIEDAAQAQGAEYNGQKAGTLGDVACFSFFPGKNLGAYGDAGAITTNNDSFAEKIKKLKNHGRQEKYTHDIVGTNSRLDTIQAAILKVKLKYLKQWNNSRRQIAEKYKEKLSTCGQITFPEETIKAKSIYHQFVIRVPNRDKVLEKLKELNIGAGIHYPIPLHLQPALKFLNHKQGDFPNAEKASKEILSLPMFPELTDEQINYITENLTKIINEN